MHEIQYEFITSFGADLQEPKSLFVKMLQEMQNGEVDVCLGVRNSRKDPIIHSLGAKIFWRINRYILGKEVPSGGFDVFMINQLVKNSMLGFTELSTNFTSQMFSIGFERKFISFDRVQRQIGKSSWTIKRKVKLFFDSIFSFSDIPIKSMLYIGLTLVFLSVAFIIFSIYFSLTGSETTSGFHALAALVVFGYGVTFLFLSVIGSYVYRTFQNSTRRPPFIVKKLISKQEIN
jgi:hypothetical protein